MDYISKKLRDSRENIWKIFEDNCPNKDGMISERDLHSMLEESGVSLTKSEQNLLSDEIEDHRLRKRRGDKFSMNVFLRLLRVEDPSGQRMETFGVDKI